MKIVIDGKEREYAITFVPARMLKKTIQLESDLQGMSDPTPETLDSMVDYIVDVYGNKFTRDEFYDGVDAEEVPIIFAEAMNRVTGKFYSKLNQFPNQ